MQRTLERPKTRREPVLIEIERRICIFSGKRCTGNRYSSGSFLFSAPLVRLYMQYPVLCCFGLLLSSNSIARYFRESASNQFMTSKRDKKIIKRNALIQGIKRRECEAIVRSEPTRPVSHSGSCSMAVAIAVQQAAAYRTWETSIEADGLVRKTRTKGRESEKRNSVSCSTATQRTLRARGFSASLKGNRRASRRTRASANEKEKKKAATQGGGERERVAML